MSADLQQALARLRSRLEERPENHPRDTFLIEICDARALLAALEWRPPETAPFTEDIIKTISYVLVDNGHHVGVGYRWKSDWDSDPEWYDEAGEEIDPPPTGWMPVPPGRKG